MSMPSGVVGGGGGAEGGLRCVPLTAERQADVLEHLRRSFFADEPLNRAIGLCGRGEAHAELEEYCLASVGQRVSCMMIDDAGKIAGTAINGIVRQSKREENRRWLAELRDEKFKSIFGLLHRLNEKVDLFDKHGVDELFECRILSVDEAFRGRGLANLLVENSIKIARDAGVKVFKTESTGLYSQKVFLKYDFQVVTEIPYSEVDKSLRPAPPHEALKLMAKVLD